MVTRTSDDSREGTIYSDVDKKNASICETSTVIT